jgi:DNA primase
MGTAFTAEQAQLLRRFSERVVLCLDGDEAGRSKTLDAALTLLEARFDVRIVTPPDGEDPDSWVRRAGTEAVERALDAAVPAADHFINVHTRGDNSIPGRARALERLAPVLALVHNRVERDLYALRLSEILGLSQEDVLKKIRMEQPRAAEGSPAGNARITAPGRAGSAPVPAPPGSQASERRPAVSGALDPYETAILQILATHPELCALEEARRIELGSDLGRLAFRALVDAAGDVRAALDALQADGTLEPESQDQVAQAFVGIAFEGHTAPLVALREALTHMRILRLKDEMARLGEEAKRAKAQGDDARASALQLRKGELQRERHQLLGGDGRLDPNARLREARPPPDPAIT